MQMQEQIADLRSELAVKSSRAAKADKKSRQLAAAWKAIDTLRELNNLMLRATRFKAQQPRGPLEICC